MDFLFAASCRGAGTTVSDSSLQMTEDTELDLKNMFLESVFEKKKVGKWDCCCCKWWDEAGRRAGSCFWHQGICFPPACWIESHQAFACCVCWSEWVTACAWHCCEKIWKTLGGKVTVRVRDRWLGWGLSGQLTNWRVLERERHHFLFFIISIHNTHLDHTHSTSILYGWCFYICRGL